MRREKDREYPPLLRQQIFGWHVNDHLAVPRFSQIGGSENIWYYLHYKYQQYSSFAIRKRDATKREICYRRIPIHHGPDFATTVRCQAVVRSTAPNYIGGVNAQGCGIPDLSTVRYMGNKTSLLFCKAVH